jgi:hypothetical protein
MDSKPRINGDGPSPGQRLKQLPWEELEFLLEQKEVASAKQIIAQIKGRHGIVVSPSRLSEFWRWLDQRVALREMNADAETFRGEFAKEHPEATLEQAHEATLAWLHLRAAKGSDEKLMKFVLGELRKARTQKLDTEKFKAAIRTKMEAAMEELYSEIKGNSGAEAAFRSLQAALETAK